MGTTNKQQVGVTLGIQAGSILGKVIAPYARAIPVGTNMPQGTTPPQRQQTNHSPVQSGNGYKYTDTATGKSYDAAGGFVPQSLLKGQTGAAAKYALSKGDYFAGITFLCEGVRPNAFYFDPASGGKYGTLINTHPGITLSLQENATIHRIFHNTSLSPLSNEIVASVRAGRISQAMRVSKLQTSDYYQMFNVVEERYSRGADNAMKRRFQHVPEANALLKQGMSPQQVLMKIKQNLPPQVYSVLEQVSYKYGAGGINRFRPLLDATIKAGLDLPNQQRHLENGAKHIVYQYTNKNKQVIQDTRVMNIHRLFYTAGNRFSRELDMKIVGNEQLNAQEISLVNQVANKAGIPSPVKNGRVEMPDATKDTVISGYNQKGDINLDVNAINRGIVRVDNNFKPHAVTPERTPASVNHDAANKAHAPTHTNQNIGLNRGGNSLTRHLLP